MEEVTEHLSQVTGLAWSAHNTVYYDCHVVSLAQILPRNVYYSWLTMAALPAIEHQWNGVSCRNKLDSEHARDVVLFDEMELAKQQLSIKGDLDETIQKTIRSQGYCICRVDSYYHEHFDEFYLKEHRTNGHKITVIDWDDEYYYGIDNLGIKTLVMKFQRNWFIESIRSNLFHVYEKEDTFYYLQKPQIDAAKENIDSIGELEKLRIQQWLEHRIAHARAFEQYYQTFVADINSPAPRPYAQVHNSYTSALMIETAYTAVHEAWQYNSKHWQTVLLDHETTFARMAEAIKAWRMFKMLCKAKDSGANVSNNQLTNILSQVVNFENKLNDIILAQFKEQESTKITC
ncbi:hypothetical protein [Candidatus Thioglobus sp.]|uniref:hypothetical protein n=1 Tax=Candidatus Thioglobus sp. TaxID=2026721 RepID=UPI003D0CA581